MALPTLIKTYSVRANGTVSAQGGVYRTKMMCFKKVKDNLVADGWTVVASSSGRIDTGAVNAGTYSTSDNWNSVTDFAGSDGLGLPSAARFPWIALQNSALGGGTFQLLLSSNNNGNNGTMLISVSPSVGFTGGAVGTNPTATDSIQLVNGTAISGLDVIHKVNTWVSSDKEVTHVIILRSQRFNETKPNICSFLSISKPQDVVSGWTNPSISTFHGAGFDEAFTYATLAAYTNRGRAAGITIGLAWTGETDRSGSQVLAEVNEIGTNANELTGEWPFFGIGMASKTATAKGRHGSFFDLWWSPKALQNGHTLPDSSTVKNFVVIGCLIFPWTNDSTQFQIAF